LSNVFDACRLSESVAKRKRKECFGQNLYLRMKAGIGKTIWKLLAVDIQTRGRLNLNQFATKCNKSDWAQIAHREGVLHGNKRLTMFISRCHLGYCVLSQVARVHLVVLGKKRLCNKNSHKEQNINVNNTVCQLWCVCVCACTCVRVHRNFSYVALLYEAFKL
jgi:hypothetical protein